VAVDLFLWLSGPGQRELGTSIFDRRSIHSAHRNVLKFRRPTAEAMQNHAGWPSVSGRDHGVFFSKSMTK
jgi:hypothetical protein